MNRQQRRAAKRPSAPAAPSPAFTAALRAFQSGAFAEAVALIEGELQRRMDDPALLDLLGTAHIRQGNGAAAEAALRRGLAQSPDNPTLHDRLALALRQQGRLAEALPHAQRAVALAPTDWGAFSNLGNLLVQMGDGPGATAAYRQALTLNPDEPSVLLQLAHARNRAAAWDEALALYERLAALQPGSAEAQNGRAMCLSSQGRYAEAEAASLKAVELAPDWIIGVTNLSALYNRLQRWEEAAYWGRRAADLNPAETIALGQWAHRLMHLADWENLRRAEELVRWNLAEGRRRFTPFALQSLEISAIDHRAIADATAADFAGRVARRYTHPAPAALAGRRLRIGYISSDFRESALSGLIGELFELHDRDAFEIHAFALDTPQPSPKRARLKAAAHAFHELAGISDEAAAAAIHATGLDLLVDLNGYTDGCRINILAARPAPIQATWLGYLGGMGGRFIDYLIADRVVTPPGSEPLYAESLIRLPGCYQINDRTRPLPPPTPRAELGLPADAVVMACFNQVCKITPSVFAVWMRVLAARPQLLLWLLDVPEAVMARLRAAAQAAGVDPARLVFAPRLPTEAHYARFQQADLFADTTPVGAGATASDALWCAVPLVTPVGAFFGARVAASLLAAVGLAGLAAGDLGRYEQVLLALIDNPGLRAQARAQLIAQRQTSSLFDSPKFARRLEWGFRAAIERRAAGLPPAGIDVPDDHP